MNINAKNAGMTINTRIHSLSNNKIEASASPVNLPNPVDRQSDQSPSFDRLQLSSESSGSNKLIQISYAEITGKYENGTYIKGKYNINEKDYINRMTELANKPSIEETRESFAGYIAGLENKLSSSLELNSESSAALMNQMDQLIQELRANAVNGISSNVDNIKTTFNIDGADFSYNELLNAKRLMDRLDRFTGGWDYQDCAKTALARAYLGRDDTGFSKEQSDALTSVFNKIIDRKMSYKQNKVEEIFRSNTAETISGLKNYYYGQGYNIASNQDMIGTIDKIFSSVNIQDKGSLDKALGRYAELMKPLYQTTQDLSSPYSDSYRNYVQNTTDKNAKELVDFWNSEIV